MEKRGILLQLGLFGFQGIDVKITDGTNVIQNVGKTSNITADQIGHLDIGAVGDATNATPGASSDDLQSYLEIATKGIIIEGIDELRIRVIGGQAGDAYEGTVRVMELGL